MGRLPEIGDHVWRVGRNQRRRQRARLNPVGDSKPTTKRVTKCRVEAAKKLLRSAGYTVTKRKKP